MQLALGFQTTSSTKAQEVKVDPVMLEQSPSMASFTKEEEVNIEPAGFSTEGARRSIKELTLQRNNLFHSHICNSPESFSRGFWIRVVVTTYFFRQLC